jgi:hypothetical protein
MNLKKTTRTMPAESPTSNETLQVRTLQFASCKPLLTILACLLLSQSNCPIHPNSLGTVRNSLTSSLRFVPNLPENPHATSTIKTNSAMYMAFSRALPKIKFSLTSSPTKLTFEIWKHSFQSSRLPLVILTKWERLPRSSTSSLRETRNSASTTLSSNI